ncbi:tetratricopeptide repeat protein [Trichocoleus sp. FACHB-69]|nr:tetratricopeptide repeat protein [Trichocoleus sp. FACHB-69]
MTFIDFAEGFIIGFIEINFSKDLDTLMEALKKHPKFKDIQFELLNFNNPELRFLRDAIIQRLPNINIDPEKKLVLILQGLEKSIGIFGEYPPVLQDLNFVRDSFTKSVPHPILFCLPDYAITRLAKFAPDFWAWKSGVFHFNTVQSTKDDALFKTLHSDKILHELEFTEKQERIDLLQRLLMEYSPSGCHEKEENLQTQMQILTQLGEAYHSRGEFTKTAECLEKALKLVNKNEDLKNEKATVLYKLGAAYALHNQDEQAIALIEQSLLIAREAGNRLLEVIILYNLGKAYSLLEQYQQAIESYQQSLAIAREIGTRKIEGITLNDLGGVYNALEQYQQAIEFYQQCLAIAREIGDRKFEVITLNDLGGVYNALEQYQQAIEFYQQCLAIAREIGDRKIEGITLNDLGGIYNALEQYQQAIEFYQQCLAIAREIGDRELKAITLNNLGGVYNALEQYQQAIEFYQQSLELYKLLDNHQAQALVFLLIGLLLAYEQGDFTTALTYLQESLAVFQQLTSPGVEKVRQIIADVQQMADAQGNSISGNT